jgi:endonuclease/exonuclease/phosphatase family metal-dependent hydrolase
MRTRRLTTRRTIAVAPSCVLLLATACATVRNYEDPHAPVYSGGSSVPRPAGDSLRVVTFNLKWGEHVERAAELFSRPGPLREADLLVLQEVDRDATERIGRALGFGWVYVPSAVHPVPKRDFGVALLSPWPLVAPRKLLLPHQNRFRKLRRAVAVATLQSPLGELRVYGVHFESPAGGWPSVRRDQARAVAADAKEWTGPVLVAGDFNGRDGPRALANAGYLWATEAVTNTAGPFDLDHVVARGLCPQGAPAAGAAEDATNASDHDPVWAVFAPGSGACADALAARGASR